MNNVPIGVLRKLSNGALELKYDAQWVESSDSIPLSLSLPLTLKTYSGDVVINYFDNLLPDNEGIRKTLAQRMSVGSPEVFDLLAAIGRDCVGAVQLVPEGEEFKPSLKRQSHIISNTEIGKILKNLKSYPLGVKPGEDFRISIAGAQEKTAFLKVRNRWHVPKGATPSSHIFKVQMGMLRDIIDMRHSVENEWLCLRICKAYGLPTANADIADFEGVRTLIVERFDREFDKNRIYRYAQEDFCQVMGIPSHKKYENEGGPGIIKIMNVLTKSDDPRRDQRFFMKSQIVFWLLAAIDGHAKNFSVFLVPGGLALTPLYDVMSAHPPIAKKQIQFPKAKLAMAVGENRHYKIKEIIRRHWLQTAKKAKYPESEMNAIIDEIIEQTPGVLSEVSKMLPPGFPKDVSEPIFKNVEKLRAVLSTVPKPAPKKPQPSTSK
jgi:serine/threonine-protein kinase HipA